MAQSKRVWLIFLGGLLLALHYALVVYVNSSLLALFFDNTKISLLYTLGSVISIISLIFAPKLLSRFGSITIFAAFILLELIAILGLGSINIGLFVMTLFVLHQASVFIISLCMDISLEAETEKENTTGRRRGMYLTAQNIAWIISPLIVSFLLGKGSPSFEPSTFSSVYFLSAIALAAFFFLVVAYFKNIRPTKNESNLFRTIKHFGNNDTTRIFFVQLILNFYYAWMVVYLPLFLAIEVGFQWHSIALILTIMLLPFLLFELPAGFLADKKFGEKETLVIGFILIAIFTSVIAFVNIKSFALWATLLFLTRIGASLVEISSESFFFKHVTSSDTGQISLFRMTRPLSFIIAMPIAIPVLYFVSYGTSFLFLGLFALLGLLFIPKKDTK